MRTLVLIDNDALSRALISQCLAGKEWRVLEAEDGESGLQLVSDVKPAAVVCDLRTPKRNGFRVCRLIRDQPQLKSTCVILTGVSRFAGDKQSALDAGADAYLTKPIAPIEFAEALAPLEGKNAAVVPPAENPVYSGPTIVRFWGVRGSIPTPGAATAGVGGNTSCVEVRVGDHIIVFDAGSGIRGLGQSLLREFKDRPIEVTMLVTHTHWDHIQGFPFFLPAYIPRATVRILGYEGAVHGLRGALFEQMQSAFFPIGLDQMASRVTFEEMGEMAFDLGVATVRTTFANHPGICLGYRLSTPAGDVVYMPDHEAYEPNERERQRLAGQNSRAELAYARLQDEKVIEFIRDADVVMADSQYDAVEYPNRLGWGHTCADDTVDLALRANVKQLFLFHHDPDHNDEKVEAMVRHARGLIEAKGGKLVVSAAREGEQFVLGKSNGAEERE